MSGVSHPQCQGTFLDTRGPPASVGFPLWLTVWLACLWSSSLALPPLPWAWPSFSQDGCPRMTHLGSLLSQLSHPDLPFIPSLGSSPPCRSSDYWASQVEPLSHLQLISWPPASPLPQNIRQPCPLIRINQSASWSFLKFPLLSGSCHTWIFLCYGFVTSNLESSSS